jgi:hypothetical protein
MVSGEAGTAVARFIIPERAQTRFGPSHAGFLVAASARVAASDSFSDQPLCADRTDELALALVLETLLEKG